MDMPTCLTNVLSTFQRIMSNALFDVALVKILLNDVIIYSAISSVNIEYICAVMYYLGELRFFVRLCKLKLS